MLELSEFAKTVRDRAVLFQKAIGDSDCLPWLGDPKATEEMLTNYLESLRGRDGFAPTPAESRWEYGIVTDILISQIVGDGHLTLSVGGQPFAILSVGRFDRDRFIASGGQAGGHALFVRSPGDEVNRSVVL